VNPFALRFESVQVQDGIQAHGALQKLEIFFVIEGEPRERE
jgi:hypothetical protein